MGRSELREQIFLMLFRVEFHTKAQMPEQVAAFFDNQLDLSEHHGIGVLEVLEEASDESSNVDAKEKMSVNNQEYIQEKYEGIMVHLTEIDDKINAVAEGWKTSRIGKVELAIIRLATYEITFDEDVPTGVAINEAVELAKKFGADDSSAFVNGILAKLV